MQVHEAVGRARGGAIAASPAQYDGHDHDPDEQGADGPEEHRPIGIAYPVPSLSRMLSSRCHVLVLFR
ncbi:MAG: hypothetical protein AMXMBFR23_14930 [Chloroflexota bacterium]